MIKLFTKQTKKVGFIVPNVFLFPLTLVMVNAYKVFFRNRMPFECLLQTVVCFFCAPESIIQIFQMIKKEEKGSRWSMIDEKGDY